RGPAAAYQQINKPTNLWSDCHKLALADGRKRLLIDRASCSRDDGLLFGQNFGIVHFRLCVESRQDFLNLGLVNNWKRAGSVSCRWERKRAVSVCSHDAPFRWRAPGARKLPSQGAWTNVNAYDDKPNCCRKPVLLSSVRFVQSPTCLRTCVGAS